MKLKSLFSKKNMQRVFSLVCALLIGVSGLIYCAAPAFASGYPFDNTFPFGYSFDYDLPLDDMEDANVPITFTCNDTTYQYLLVRDSGVYYSHDGTIQNALHAFDPSSAAPWGGLSAYRYFVVSYIDPVVYNRMLQFFDQFGVIYYFSGLYRIRQQTEPLTFPLDNETIPFYSNGQLFHGFYTDIATVGGGSGVVFGYLNEAAQKVPVISYRWVSSGTYDVFSIDDRYSIIEFLSPYVPTSIVMALSLDNYFVSYEPSVFDFLTSGFTAAIGWLGDFFTSLFTSNLVLAFVLISVGFGISLLSFGWRWIRRWLWGY